MSRIVLVLLVALAVFSASTSGQQCGVNEEFKSCGSQCEPSCAQPKIDFCTFNCKIGCQCKDGFLRNDAGACVSPESC
ncbi:chymotrypsin inhibitor-like [Colletes gigas]|uniref:chymotrypsin inhibitor-like n=1 Tax=Colletes gigas TaxID=935657 RepID=UPI001C9AA7D3|nr:chymotrypsin inhibitor-like [Colletes gigas]